LSDEKPTSRGSVVLIGTIVALTGVAIMSAAIWGGAEKFHAPRWVVGSFGGAFLLFGGWTAAVYALGYDPQRPEETLPSPGVQLMALVPGMLLFAAPFHWIAFGPGPREFSTTLSIPFLSTRTGAPGLSGRIAFGLGAVVIDAILVAAVIRLVRAGRRERGLTR
jgi:hypothetical protein